MPIVRAELISVEEARENRDNALHEMFRHLRDLDRTATEAAQRHAGRPSARHAPVFKTMRVLAGKLLRDYGERADRQAKFSGADKQTQRILALFNQLPVGLSVDETIIQVETCAVLAHACARRMADAADLMADPEKAMSLNPDGEWTFVWERERIAAEFATRYPVYRGCCVKVEPMVHGMSVRLYCRVAGADPGGETPLQELIGELEKFLAWELRKIGVDMEYENIVSDTPDNKLLICTMRVADTEDERPSPEQVSVPHGGDGNAGTVSTGNAAIAALGSSDLTPAQGEQLIGSGPRNTRDEVRNGSETVNNELRALVERVTKILGDGQRYARERSAAMSDLADALPLLPEDERETCGDLILAEAWGKGGGQPVQGVYPEAVIGAVHAVWENVPSCREKVLDFLLGHIDFGIIELRYMAADTLVRVSDSLSPEKLDAFVDRAADMAQELREDIRKCGRDALEQLIESGPRNKRDEVRKRLEAIPETPGLNLNINKIEKSDIGKLLSFLRTNPTDKAGVWENAGPREEGVRVLQKLDEAFSSLFLEQQLMAVELWLEVLKDSPQWTNWENSSGTDFTTYSDYQAAKISIESLCKNLRYLPEEHRENVQERIFELLSGDQYHSLVEWLADKLKSLRPYLSGRGRELLAKKLSSLSEESK